ncbi:hypothetical protein ILUMI_12885 [Ignelater luminosus]|uniref:Uncharacterized protein n=1 Tax=Ignelater luminosus TaxID=2038154 RepID=A0A8K0CTF0_IGNLU|nr:hypothetical protein ILUMI_12885 [Ignelater luminosus]
MPKVRLSVCARRKSRKRILEKARHTKSLNKHSLEVAEDACNVAVNQQDYCQSTVIDQDTAFCESGNEMNHSEGDAVFMHVVIHDDENDQEFVRNSYVIDEDNNEHERTSTDNFYDVEMERVNTNVEFCISGKRIVDIGFFLSALKSLKHEGFGCSFYDMVLINEKIEELESIFYFKCVMCNRIESVRSAAPNKFFSPNMAAVIGCV